MAEDPQTGPVPPEGRPAIGARLAMGFLAVVRTFLVFPAMLLAVWGVGLLFAVCFVEAPVFQFLVMQVGVLAATELVFATAVGAKWIEDQIRLRSNPAADGMPDPTDSAGHLVVLMIEVLLLFSGAALLLWIPAELGREQNLGPAWPAFWITTGALAWWGRRQLLEWFRRRAITPDTGPCSTPETPPSGEP